MEHFLDTKKHWNNAYSSKPTDQLGWYEEDVTETCNLIDKASIASNARILIVGAGTTTLIDRLLEKGFTNIIASDLSEVSLNKLKQRLGEKSNSVQWLVDDLTNSTELSVLEPVDLWIDRAVLHFFIEENDRKNYFKLLDQLVKPIGYAIFAEFSLYGASKCSELNVHRYSNELFINYLGNSFELLETFDHTYSMPSGDLRPYIYSLFKKVK